MKTAIIAGAGIIGLAIALELNACGFQVTVLDRGDVLRESSWAAAGMLAADDPENPPGMAQLSRFSRDLYPEFLERIRELSGLTIRLRTRHAIQLCEHALLTPGAERLSSAETLRRVPGLVIPDNHVALWLREDSLDPRDLCAALALAVRAAGIRIFEQTPVLAARASAGGVLVSTGAGELQADRLIVATGAWSAIAGGGQDLHTLPAGLVTPRKGQMLRVEAPPDSSLDVVLRSPQVYIVPRDPGTPETTLVIGATVEDVGFDRSIQPQSSDWLLQQAAHLWKPFTAANACKIVEVWTGLRPGTADAMPILGNTVSPFIYFATGHSRNGILLAPGTARVVAQSLCGKATSVSIEPFSPQRLMHDHQAS